MDWWSSIAHAGFAGWSTLGLLLLLSVLSWTVMLQKFFIMKQAREGSRTFLDSFWKSRDLENLYESTKEASSNPLQKVFQTAYVELIKLTRPSGGESAREERLNPLDKLDNVERALRRASASETARLERYLSFLATIGSTAPFIGLFGTVVGIMRAFRQIGLTGSANLADVAPGISEALIATAAGLAAAIPAVVGYNYFQSGIRNLSTELESFSADFLNIVKRHFLAA